MFRILLGIVLGAIFLPLGVFAWLYLGKPPVAVADTPFPQERMVTHALLDKRIDRELVKTPPLLLSEDVLVAGAKTYSEQCASCHGFHGKPSAFGGHMYPPAPQLWEKHHQGNVVGVSDDPPGETYWKIANGIRLTGMPAYKQILGDQQMWEVTLLLASADKPLPPAAVEILDGTAAPLPATETLAPPAH